MIFTVVSPRPTSPPTPSSRSHRHTRISTTTGPASAVVDVLLRGTGDSRHDVPLCRAILRAHLGGASGGGSAGEAGAAFWAAVRKTPMGSNWGRGYGVYWKEWVPDPRDGRQHDPAGDIRGVGRTRWDRGD